MGFDDIREKVKKEMEDEGEFDEDSDHPVRDKVTKEKKFKK